MYIGLISVLFLLGAVAVQEARSFEAAYQARSQAMLDASLRQAVDRWESLLEERLGIWFSALASSDDPVLIEAQARVEFPFFDAVYTWDGDEITFPAPATEEDLASLRRHPCVQTAESGLLPDSSGRSTPIGVADALAACLADPNPGVRLLAASDAAEIFLNFDQPASADRTILSLVGLVNRPLTGPAVRGVDVRRLVILRLQHARAMEALGRTDIAQLWLSGLAADISALDAPRLERVLDLYEWPLAHDLRLLGGPELGGEADEDLQRAQRRLAAWKELRSVDFDPRRLPALGESPRALVDPYADPPWLVFASRLGLGDLTAAVQVDQAVLLRWLLSEPDAGFRDQWSIRDPNGRVLAGSSDELAVEVAFTRVLPHLRAGITRSAEASPSQTRRAFVSRLLPFGIAILLGGIALYALIRTDRRQEVLMQRQRDFVARVSHELKTPLAGIRLMAETIEMGAYRDEAQREAFALRIVQETERLTARVNEVLRAATEPSDDVAVPIDIDAMVKDISLAWTPRFAQAGGVLEVQAQPVGTVVGMPVLLRDAVNNLLDNAIKYRKENQPGRAWLRVRSDKKWVYFEVEDNGLGVPTSLRKAIFDRFRRVEGPGRGKSGGHGLGLAFVSETAKLHGGKAECLDGVDGGSKFVVRIRKQV